MPLALAGNRSSYQVYRSLQREPGTALPALGPLPGTVPGRHAGHTLMAFAFRVS